MTHLNPWWCVYGQSNSHFQRVVVQKIRRNARFTTQIKFCTTSHCITIGSQPCVSVQTSPHTTVLSVPPLGPPDVRAGLERGLRAAGRRLRDDQWEPLLEACVRCPGPLYLQAALWESRLWTSYCEGPPGGLGTDLEGLYRGLLARLEREHGQHLVRRVATVMGVSRGGCTEEVGACVAPCHYLHVR